MAPHILNNMNYSVCMNISLQIFDREGAGTFREYLILGWGGVVGGVSDPQNGKIQKVPRVLFEDKMRYFFTILMTFR